ncbi:tolloid-like protein 1 [Sergentomyia squamirostris]
MLCENIRGAKITKEGVNLISFPSGTSDTFKDHCNKTVDIYVDVASPEVTNLNRGQPLTCWYRFRSFRGAPRDWVLRLRFNKFKVGTLINATHCDGGYLQVS